jgi:hypothetical protein
MPRPAADLRVAQDYQQYLNDRETINALIGALGLPALQNDRHIAWAFSAPRQFSRLSRAGSIPKNCCSTVVYGLPTHRKGGILKPFPRKSFAI